MRELIHSSITNSLAIAVAGSVALAPAISADRPAAVVDANVTLAAVTGPPPGALLEQFLVNQVQNCAAICPYIIQGVIEVPVTFALIPVTFFEELQAGTPLLQAIARSDATVSGAAKAAVDGIIDNDLRLVLPRFQFAVEVGVLGLLRLGDDGIAAARTDLLDALDNPLEPPPTSPPAVRNDAEAAVIRVIEVTAAVTFQAPERLLQGAVDTTDVFFRTVGDTGDIGLGLEAAGVTASAALNDSVQFVRDAIDRPIPRVDATAPAIESDDDSTSETATSNLVRQSGRQLRAALSGQGTESSRGTHDEATEGSRPSEPKAEKIDRDPAVKTQARSRDWRVRSETGDRLRTTNSTERIGNDKVDKADRSDRRTPKADKSDHRTPKADKSDHRTPKADHADRKTAKTDRGSHKADRGSHKADRGDKNGSSKPDRADKRSDN